MEQQTSQLTSFAGQKESDSFIPSSGPPVDQLGSYSANQNRANTLVTPQRPTSFTDGCGTNVPRGPRPHPEIPRPDKRTSILKVHQLWFGTVRDVADDSFWAVVSDRSHPQNPDERVELNMEEVSTDDKPLVHSGATFYWAVGMERTPGGTQQRVSRIQFLRAPNLSLRAKARIKARKRDIANVFAASKDE
jgi:hypothetical protein